MKEMLLTEDIGHRVYKLETMQFTVANYFKTAQIKFILYNIYILFDIYPARKNEANQKQ